MKLFKFLLIPILISLFVVSVFAKEYKRIISLAPSVTRSLYELDIDKELIGITMYCPQGKTKKEIIGTFAEPDLEKIISLKPDLIITSKDGNSKAYVEKLQRIGFEIYIMEMAESFEDICNNFILLAKFIDKESLAKELVGKSKKQVEEINEKSKLLKTQSVFWEIGEKPLYTAGSKSFLNSYNCYTNTKNLYADMKSRYLPIDIENVLTRNPDIIIVINMSGDKSYEVESKKYMTSAAFKSKKIHILSADLLFGLTPTTFAQALKEIANIVSVTFPLEGKGRVRGQ